MTATDLATRLGTLDDQEVAPLDAWWRDCNHLTIGQIYLPAGLSDVDRLVRAGGCRAHAESGSFRSRWTSTVLAIRLSSTTRTLRVRRVNGAARRDVQPWAVRVSAGRAALGRARR